MAEVAGGDASGAGRRTLERPALAGGERYLHAVEMAGTPIEDDGWRPQPVWQVAQNLGPRIQRVIDRSQDLVLSQDGRVVMEARLMPNFLAATNWPGKLFAATGARPVGSRPSRTDWIKRKETTPDTETKSVLLSVDNKALQSLAEIIERPTNQHFDAGLVDQVARFDELRLPDHDDVFRPGAGEVRTDDQGRLLLESVLHPQLRRDGLPDLHMAKAVLDDWSQFVGKLGGSVNSAFVREDQGMHFVPLILPPGCIAEAVRFAQLRVLRPVPEMRPIREVGKSTWRLETPPEGELISSGRIAVFDGGVDLDAPGIRGYVTNEDLTGGTPVLPHYQQHGTAVCSAALYGHLAPAPGPSVPHTGVDHFRVWPPPDDHRHDADLGWVLAAIEQVIARGQHRIAVISLAPDLSIEDLEPHAWTTALDRLALDHDVLFVIAAGNTGDLAPGVNRLLVPADSVNGLSVGACTAPRGSVVRADYSSVGPGRPGGRTAPNGVQFGGDLSAAPFGALRGDGSVGEFEGTSFAAPVVARGIAELDAAIEGGASANLLRTMAVHFADAPAKGERNQAGRSTADVGYGRFSAAYADHLEHSRDSVTVVSEGQLKRKDQVSLPFMIPTEVFAAFATKRFEISWTLGFLGPVEPANPVDYSCGGLRVVFRPHSERYTLSPPEGVTGDPVPVDRTTEFARLQHYVDDLGWRVSKRPAPSKKDGYAPEVVQRARDGKWETLVHMARNMNGASLNEPCIDIHVLGREGGVLEDVPVVVERRDGGPGVTVRR